MGKNYYEDITDQSNKADKKGGKNNKKKTLRSRKIGYVLAFIQLLLTILFIGILIYVNLVPTSYLIGIIVILAFFVIYDFGTQLTRSRKLRLIGKIIAVFMSIILAIGSFYLFETSGMLAKITGANTKTDLVSVIVLDSDPAKSLSDVKDYNFGIVEIIDRVNTNKAIDKINTLTSSNIATTEYSDFHSLVQALYDGKTKVIILNEAQRSNIVEDFEDFNEHTRVIETFRFITKLNTSNSNVKVTKEPFIVYLSGNDLTGDVAGTGRSDVNICAVVNPKTSQILLVSTPRDAFVELIDPSGQVPAGSMDKLTHASNFGIDTSMKTLGRLYNVSIDYFIRVNFTGFVDIVDALGGITVDSEYEFTSIDGFHFNKGINELDGTYALHYARERKAFALGDMQRNKHQTQVLTAIMGKLVSTNTLTNYSSLMNGVGNAFLTDFSSSEISDLVKMQLNNGNSWDIVSYNVMGTVGHEYVFSINSFTTSVVYLNDTDVTNAKSLMQKVLNGETISNEYIDSLSMQTVTSSINSGGIQ